jgi:CheY-like chemotaxis protein/anti-sigma regulatory factor (Ser/Thr protein kinase)
MAASSDDPPRQPLADGAWIAAISHDLRDPMNAVLGMTRLLLETDLDETQRRYAETVEDAASGMMTLINDLLDIGRLARGDVAVRAEPFDLHRLVRGSLDVVRPRATDRPVALELDLAADSPRWVAGDAGRLRQVLVNLLANALKFTTRGEVVLAVRPAAADHVAFAVSDTGCGLAPADRERVFQPFVQLSTNGGGGVGLGLAIARLVVDRLGGTLELDSEEGAGSTFTVTLPLPATAAPAAGRASLAGRGVVLVDAATPVRTRTARALEALGARVTVTNDAAATTAALAAGEAAPDAVLLVAVEPDDGATALARALADVRPGSVALALAPSGVRGASEAWRRAGFAGYLPYPVRTETLADALGILLAAEPAARAFLTEPGLEDRRGSGRRVLAVDDNPLNARLLRVLLEKAGHRVSVVGDGEAAVEAVAAGEVDVVLMDLQLPGISGIEAARRIRALDGAAAAVPIVAVTANAGGREAEACRAAGMDGFVTKPIDRVGLLDAMERALATAAGADAGV